MEALGTAPNFAGVVANGGRFASMASDGSLVFMNEEARAPTLPEVVGLSLTNACLASDKSSDCSSTLLLVSPLETGWWLFTVGPNFSNFCFAPAYPADCEP